MGYGISRIETENPCVDSSILSLGTQRRRCRKPFAELVDRSAGPDACHPWQGALDKNGYGRFSKRYLAAHRIACEEAHGPPPFPGAEAAHSCDNPPCCNGRHLSWKTHAANVAEQFERGNHRNFRPHGKPYICGVCGGAGHNARTCKKLPGGLARGEITIRKARALFGLTRRLSGGAQ